MSFATALMYHTLYDGDYEWGLLQADERPYAISVSEFNRQLDALEKENILILDPIKLLKDKSFNGINNGVILTFDDGHSSFYRYAYKILKKRGYRAIFFITTDLIVQRDDFCSWDNLLTMAQDGFMVQAHGKSHQFLPELDHTSLESEYKEPKLLLEQHTGQKVFTMSFPGGRFQQREIEVGKNLGYEIFFTSRIGIISNYSLKNNFIFDRIPIRNKMKLNSFIALAKGKKTALWPRLITYRLKAMLKLILGNHIYHVVYQIIFKR